MAAESIGNLIPTKIPGYSDAADIQAALRLYHYGSYTFDISETDPSNLVNPSIAYTINDFEDRISTIESGSGNINSSIFTAKGSLISSSAAATAIELTAGSNGKVLSANSATSSGLEWITPSVSVSNVTGLASNIATFLTTSSSANLAAAMTDETGTGSLVFSNGPTLTTPKISSISNTGTLTLPTSTDTLIGRNTTDTLTNKTISLTNNSLTGTISEFNSALSGDDFATQSSLDDIFIQVFMMYGY